MQGAYKIVFVCINLTKYLQSGAAKESQACGAISLSPIRTEKKRRTEF